MEPGPSKGASTTSNGTDAPKTRRQVRRLTPEGYKLLDEMYAEDPRPDAQKQREILARVRALKGCEHYAHDTLGRFFYQRRKKDKEMGTTNPTPASSHDILFPSLSSDALHSLEVLIAENPEPLAQEIDIWAKALKVKTRDVETWVYLKLARPSDASMSTSVPQRHLPTPEPSTSPEPTHAVLPPFYAASTSTSPTTNTPISPILDDKQDRLIKLLAASASAPPLAPPPIRKQTPAKEKQKLSIHQLQELGSEISHAIATQDPPIVVTSSQEFCRVMDDHNEKMNAFLKKVHAGDYARWGWDPKFVGDLSLPPPPPPPPSGSTSQKG